MAIHYSKLDTGGERGGDHRGLSRKMETFPDTTVPAGLHDVDFMVKDSKRFADSGGWGWGAFKYDAASDTFTPFTLADQPPQGSDAKCGLACHTIVKTASFAFAVLNVPRCAAMTIAAGPRELAAIGSAAEWLNSPRLTPSSLAGEVVPGSLPALRF